MKRHAPAAARNREPILAVLRTVLPPRGVVLHIAEGSGEHAVHFAAGLPALTFQPSDPDPDARASIEAHRLDAGLDNLRSPLAIDVLDPTWPELLAGTSVAAIVCINMIHIAPWEACLGLFAGAARLLAAGDLLVLYGPFRFDGVFTAPSNEAFDASLRERDPRWGVRDRREVIGVAQEAGFVDAGIVEMPANNHVLIVRRAG